MGDAAEPDLVEASAPTEALRVVQPAEPPSQLQEQPSGRWPRAQLQRPGVRIGAAAALVLLLVLGFVLFRGGSGGHEITGTFTLYGADNITGGADDCEGDGGYSDFSPGVPVTVRDENDHIVGSGALKRASTDEIARRIAAAEEGDLKEAKETVGKAQGFVICALVFDAKVKDAEFYDINVGTRGKITNSRADLEKRDWSPSFSLGN